MLGRILKKIKERVRNLQLQKAKQLLLTRAASGRQPLQHVKEGRIHQQLDHFNRQDVNTFPQVKKHRTMLYKSGIAKHVVAQFTGTSLGNQRVAGSSPVWSVDW